VTKLAGDGPRVARPRDERGSRDVRRPDVPKASAFRLPPSGPQRSQAAVLFDPTRPAGQGSLTNFGFNCPPANPSTRDLAIGLISPDLMSQALAGCRRTVSLPRRTKSLRTVAPEGVQPCNCGSCSQEGTACPRIFKKSLQNSLPAGISARSRSQNLRISISRRLKVSFPLMSYRFG
jgi:hypothetical protein